MIYKVDDTKKVEPLFSDWNDTLIWSCLQNIMGNIYVDSLEKPLSAMAILADFSFLTGQPNEELVLYKPEGHDSDFIIMVAQNTQWEELIVKCYGAKAKKITRYAIKKDPNVFDREKLQDAVRSLSPEYSLKMIDEDIFNLCKESDWSRDFVSQYKDYEMYRKMGLGAVILKDGELISGASSYTSYKDGIEIEVDTKEGYRRRGLAYVCSAKLILECLDRGLYPSWDAQNKWSVALAEKLGYEFDHEYTAYEIWEY
ncbi:MAG TPA: GNAT family N-acetyltransferase [Clostridiales bacterium]|nr:GNAT family N-acetyltransferase [Clostridiales bacterium]